MPAICCVTTVALTPRSSRDTAMRVVLVTHFFPAHGGGVEKVAAQLAACMAAVGVEVVWCASDTDAVPAIAGVRCVPMRTFNGVERWTGFPYPIWSPGSWRQLAACIRQADAVHAHDCIYAGSLLSGVLCRLHRKRLIVTQHIGFVPLPWFLRPLLKAANLLGAMLVLRQASGVAFISPQVRGYFAQMGFESSRFCDVANGVDHHMFTLAQRPPQGGREALGFDSQRPLLLFVGRFVAKKRLSLVQAMAEARPAWQWCVIGQGPDRPESWNLPNVRVLPPMPQAELVAYYREADLLVLPSHGEGFPLVIQEAMACGLPACVTADVAAGGEMPKGLWLELHEPEDQMAHRAVCDMEDFLARPANERSRQRAACAQHARATWNWDRAAQAHLGWLQDSSA